jgi:aminomethyltransferase
MTPPIAYSPLTAWQRAQGARFADYGNWRLVSVFSGVEQEQTAARTGLALADISSLAKVSLQGKGVGSLIEQWFGKLRPGHAGLIGEGKSAWACVLKKDHCFLHALFPDQHLAEFPAELSYDMTSAYAGLALFGPEHGKILRQLSSLDVPSTGMRPGSCSQSALAGAPAIFVGQSGNPPCTRIFFAWDLAEYVWDRLWQIGRRLGLAALGMEAYRTLAPGLL